MCQVSVKDNLNSEHSIYKNKHTHAQIFWAPVSNNILKGIKTSAYIFSVLMYK